MFDEFWSGLGPSASIGDDEDDATVEERSLASSMSIASPLLNNLHRKRSSTQISIEDVSNKTGALDEVAALKSINARRRRGEHDDLSKGVNSRRQLHRGSISVTSQKNCCGEAKFKEEATAEAKLLLQKFLTGQDEPKPIATSTRTRLVTACKVKLLEVFARGNLSSSNIPAF